MDMPDLPPFCMTAWCNFFKTACMTVCCLGELGWELYVNMPDLPGLYDSLVANGQQFGLGHVGNRVINTLRIEKGNNKS